MEKNLDWLTPKDMRAIKAICKRCKKVKEFAYFCDLLHTMPKYVKNIQTAYWFPFRTDQAEVNFEGGITLDIYYYNILVASYKQNRFEYFYKLQYTIF